MRQVLSDSGSNRSRPYPMKAPIGGWNAVDSIADMPPADAIFLDNWFPRTSDVIMRKGMQTVATLPEGKNIRTLMGYKSTSGNAKLFAAAEDGIYDITAGGSIASPAIVGTSNAWEHVNISTAGGSFLECCNGVDEMKLYDGTTWKTLNATSTPAITGLPTNEVTNIALFKTRVILCRKGSLSFWYLPNNAIAGAAVEFPLGALFRKGGYLMATTTWTVDGGNGPDDYFVAITSEGEVAVYKGTDPSSSSTFGIVGIFQLAAPMSRRCFTKLDNDTAVITRAAVYPLSKALGKAETDPRVGISRKVSGAYSDMAEKYASLYGWQISLFSDASMLLVNVPTLYYTPRQVIYSNQLVMNTITGAWCRFTGMDAEVMLPFDRKLYLGLKNVVNQAWVGTNDNGAAIISTAKTAFNTLRTPRIKKVHMIKPVFEADRTVELRLGIDVDYDETKMRYSTVSYSQALSRWDEAKWNEAPWNGNSSIVAKWRKVNCQRGRVISVRLRGSASDATMRWIATELLVEDGGIM